MTKVNKQWSAMMCIRVRYVSTYGPGPRHSRRVHLCYMRNLLASEIYFPIHVHLKTASKKVKYVNILLRDWKVHVVYGWHILQSSRSMIFSHGSFTLCRARCLIMKGNFCSFHCVVKSSHCQCHWKIWKFKNCNLDAESSWWRRGEAFSTSSSEKNNCWCDVERSPLEKLKSNLCTQVSKAATVEKAEQAEQTPWSLASEE